MDSLLDSTNSSSIFLDPPLQPPLEGGAALGTGGGTSAAAGPMWWIGGVFIIVLLVSISIIGVALFVYPMNPTGAAPPSTHSQPESCSAAKKSDYKRPASDAVSLSNKPQKAPAAAKTPAAPAKRQAARFLSENLYKDLNPVLKTTLNEPWNDLQKPVEVCSKEMDPKNQLTKDTELAPTVIPTRTQGALQLAQAALENPQKGHAQSVYQAKKAIEGMSSSKGFEFFPTVQKAKLPEKLFSQNEVIEAKTLAARQRAMTRDGNFLRAAAMFGSINGDNHELAQNLALESTNTPIEGYEYGPDDLLLLHNKPSASNEKPVHLARQAQRPTKLVPGHSWSPLLD